ncbi:MAG: Peptidoglycan-binding domain 1 [Candidatus Angelobacter sp.]|nr:Peptidoglycan-binding domain 1 [Candidatus Angelobacter sp.]
MRFIRIPLIFVTVLFTFLLPVSIWAKASASSKTPQHKSTDKAKIHNATSKSSKSSKKGKGKKSWQAKGQKTISDDRTREIQAALIREKYLTGEPTGQMDGPTRQALIKLQEQNGWQTKIVPDSRALIKLGLGPNHENLLNPETAAMPSAVASRQ